MQIIILLPLVATLDDCNEIKNNIVKYLGERSVINYEPGFPTLTVREDCLKEENDLKTISGFVRDRYDSGTIIVHDSPSMFTKDVNIFMNSK